MDQHLPRPPAVKWSGSKTSGNMAGQSEFPVMFVVDGSNRHEGRLNGHTHYKLCIQVQWLMRVRQ